MLKFSKKNLSEINAPEWVKFTAFNLDGKCYGYESKPYKKRRNGVVYDEWRGNTRSVFLFELGEEASEWENTLAQIVDDEDGDNDEPYTPDATTEKAPEPVQGPQVIPETPHPKPVQGPQAVPSKPTSPRGLLDAKSVEFLDDHHQGKLGLLTSNARPEYTRAAEYAKTAPEGSYAVFSYRPQWVAPDAVITPGETATVFVACHNNVSSIEAVRVATIVSCTFDAGKLFIGLRYESKYVSTRAVEKPQSGACVFTF